MTHYCKLILCGALLCAPYIYTVNIVVKPETVRATQNPPTPLVQPVPTIAPVPAPPPAPATEKSLTIINTTIFPMNIRFETSTNPGVVDTIPAHNSKRINYKINTLVMYSFEELKSQPITPNMISQDVATIATPPELLPKQAPAPLTSSTPPPTQTQSTAASQPSSANAAFTTSQLPAAASSQGPPGFKSERPR